MPVRTPRAPSSRRIGALLLALPIVVVLLWTVVYPNVAVVVGSFGHGLGYWRAFAASPADRAALVATLAREDIAYFPVT